MEFKIDIKLALFVLFSFVTLSLQSCDDSNKREYIDPDSAAKKEKIPFSSFPVVKYNLDTIATREELVSIINRFRNTPQNRAAFRAFTTLNRKELRYISVGSAVVIPDTIISDLRGYSIFPAYYEGAKDLKKLVVVSAVYQAYGCYEYGKLVRFAAVNSGKERTPSYPGRYSMSWKERVHRSSIDSTWLMPFTINIHMQAGSAMHKFEMPGKPASHSCLRQFLEDAEWIYYWGEMIKFDGNKRSIPLSGTPIIIVGHYDFAPGRGYQWKYLKNSHEQVVKLPDNPMAVEEALIPISQIPKESRGSLRDIKRYIYAEDTLRARGIIRPGVVLIVTKNYNRIRRIKAKAQLEKQKLEIEKQNGGVVTP